MRRCAHRGCGTWRPAFLVRLAHLGVFLDGAWFCSAKCLRAATRQRLLRTASVPAATSTAAQARLGGLLAAQKKLATGVLDQAVSEQEKTGLRIGMQLVELGVVTKFDVLRALAAQAGVGFLTAIDASRLGAAPGNVSPQVVAALGLVPFEADRRHDVLKVACTAPVPRSAIAALRELTGSIIEPYLVADDQWPALAQAYGTTATAPAPLHSVASGLDAVVTRVAAAVREGSDVRMSEVRFGHHLWVRLDIDGRVEELLVALPAPAASAEAVTEKPLKEAPSSTRRRRSRPSSAAKPTTTRPRPAAAQPLAVAAPVNGRRVRRTTRQASRPRVPQTPASFLDGWDERNVRVAGQSS